MLIETAIKNYILEEVIRYTNVDSFEENCKKALSYYKRHQVNSNNYKKEFKKMLNTKNRFYSNIEREYGRQNNIITHFYHSDRNLPIWVVFEIISMGDLGSFASSLDLTIKKNISLSLNLYQPMDTDGLVAEKMIYTLKDLRNAIAHNNIIFDTRFKNSNIDNVIGNMIRQESRVNNIDFNSIFDYFALIVYLMEKLKVTKTEIKNLIKNFKNEVSSFESKVNTADFFKIFHSSYHQKLTDLENYIVNY